MPMVDTDMTAGRAGQKLSPEAAAEAVIGGVERGRPDIAIGQVGMLKLLMRLSPTLGYRILRNG